jgi:hypothetical protein
VFFMVNVVFRGINRRLTALVPATRLREKIDQLIGLTEQYSSQTTFCFPHLLNKSADPGSLYNLQSSLTESGLSDAGYLPWTIVNPFGAVDASMDYRNFLASRSNQVDSFTLIVSWGATAISESWSDVEKFGVKDAGIAALTSLDSLSITVGGPSQLLASQIQGILDTLTASINQAKSTVGGAAPTQLKPMSQPNVKQITTQLEAVSAATWIIWALLTVIVGSCALVWFNDGFGIGQDYLKCFLWGVGMPAVSQGFGALNANSVVSAFSLQVPH